MRVSLLLKNIFQAQSFQAFLADMEALDVTPVKKGGRAYALIAARSNLRWWLLPLESGRVAAAGLEMMQPVNRMAKITKIVLQLSLLFGINPYIAKLRFSDIPDLSETFGPKAIHVAYFTGTDGPHRKTTMQIMNADGKILGYGKLSRMKYIRPYICHEADTLAHVAAMGLRSAIVPSVLACHKQSNLTLLLTDSRKSLVQKTTNHIGVVHLNFLNELRKQTKSVGAKLLLEDLSCRVVAISELAGSVWVDRITQALGALEDDAEEIEICLVHGDFTPWNSFIHSNKLYVFDWEYANIDWPVGYDLAHYILSTTSIKRQPHILPNVLVSLGKNYFEGNEILAHRALLLSLVCHAVFYLSRLADVKGELTDWIEAPVRAVLIDRLLDKENFNS